MRRLIFCLLLALPSAVLAIPRAMPDDQLLAQSTNVVEALVTSVTFVKTEQTAEFRTDHYKAELQVTRSTKGSLRAGKIITVTFITPTFIGTGEKPIGGTPQASYAPCEKVHVYLKGDAKGYELTGWNGKKTLTAPAKVLLPSKPNAKVRCVKGQPR